MAGPDVRLRELDRHGGGQGREHGRAAARRAAGRHSVSRLHRGGGLRHHSGRRRRTHAVGAAALSHDLWVSVVRKGHADAGEQPRVARIATLALGIVAVGLGVTFKGQNVAFMVSLAFAIAAVQTFPLFSSPSSGGATPPPVL